MTDKTQALKFSLDRTKRRLEEFKQRNSGIPDDKIMREFAQNEGIYWEDLEQILDAANNAVLTEAPFATAGNIAGDKQAALDEFEQMLSFIALSHSYWGTCDKDFISDFAVNTIRAALTAQQPEKPYIVDGDGALRQTKDVNAELLEALKEAWSVVSSINYGKNHVIKRSDGEVLYGQTDEWCMWALKEVLPKMEQAIARAEQKGGV